MIKIDLLKNKGDFICFGNNEDLLRDTTVYIEKFEYSTERGTRKQSESANGLNLLKYAVNDKFSENTDNLHIKKGDFGKPYFENSNICFNVSHSGDYVAVAVGKCSIGVDVQIIKSVKYGLIRKICDSTELEYIANSDDKNRAFIRLWTLKESYVKCIGMGLSFPMNKINFSFAEKTSNKDGFYLVKDYDDFVLALSLRGC